MGVGQRQGRLGVLEGGRSNARVQGLAQRRMSGAARVIICIGENRDRLLVQMNRSARDQTHIISEEIIPDKHLRLKKQYHLEQGLK